VVEGEKRQVIEARRMTQKTIEPGERKALSLRDGRFIEFPRSGPGGKVTRFEQAEYPLVPENQANSRYRRKASSSIDLWRSLRLEDIAELQWRFSTPLSTLLLALLAVPLSKSNPRKGKFAKIGLGIVIFAFYYQLFVIAKTWVEKGRVAPLPGIWWVPLLLAALFLILLWRTGEVFYRRSE
jgi:lipopolysaccharide export system permease protein